MQAELCRLEKDLIEMERKNKNVQGDEVDYSVSHLGQLDKDTRQLDLWKKIEQKLKDYSKYYTPMSCCIWLLTEPKDDALFRTSLVFKLKHPHVSISTKFNAGLNMKTVVQTALGMRMDLSGAH
jgi:hypothetical protein